MEPAERDALIARLGIKYMAVFVPQSASRNSQEKHPSLNWRVTLLRSGGGVVAMDYMQGIGHLPKDPRARFNPHCHSIAQDKYERECAQSGRYAGGNIPAPPLADVLYSLLLDGEAANESFEDWCSNFGYDSDSRKAEETYNACRTIGRQLQRMFTSAELAELREAFQDY